MVARPTILAALLALAAAFAASPAAHAVPLDWWASRTSSTCIIEPSNRPGGVRLDNCADGVVEGDITLPTSGNWRLSFDVEPDESALRKINDYVDVFIDGAPIGHYFNTPAAPALHHVHALVSGSAFHYKFVFHSTDLATHIHLVVRPGDAQPDPVFAQNPGFETGTYVPTSPTGPGGWQGNQASFVPAENGITPLSGTKMLKFSGTANGGASAGAGSEAIQLVPVSAYASEISAHLFTLVARAFANRVAGDAQTDSQFGIELLACSGSMASFPPPASSILARSRSLVVTDGDPATWQRIPDVTLVPPAGTTYIAAYLFADENVFNDAAAPEFDGHYADGFQLLRLPPPAVSIASVAFPEGNVGATFVPLLVTCSAPLHGPGILHADTFDGGATLADADYAALHSLPRLWPTTMFAKSWGTLGSGSTQMNGPSGITTDAHGSIYVVDQGNNRIKKHDVRGDLVTQWGSFGSGNGQFYVPACIAAEPVFSDVYVTDTANNRVQRFTSSGAYVSQWGSPGTGPGQFDYPAGIAVDSQGNVYVADNGNRRIQKFSATGTFLLQWTGPIPANLISPWGVAVDRADHVWVSDPATSRIQEFSSSGDLLLTLGPGDANILSPLGLSTDAYGNLYVADNSDNTVHVFSATGQSLEHWGGSGSGEGQFSDLADVHVSGEGVVYVADHFNHRVQVFEAIDPSATVTTLVRADTKLEPTEAFTVVLSNPSWLSIASSTGLVTIQNDDVSSFSTGGAAASVIGGATAEALADGFRLTNLGAGGTDGVALGGGGMRLSGSQPGGIGFAADFASSATIPGGGAQVTARMLGSVGGVPNVTMGSYQVQLQPGGPNHYGVDFSGVGASQYKVSIYDGSTLVHQVTNHSGTGIAYQSCPGVAGIQATGDPIPGVDINLEQIPGGIAVTARHGSCSNIDLGDGSGVHPGDRVVFTAPVGSVLRAGDAMSGVQFTSSLASLDVKRFGLRVLGNVHRATGNALYAANYNSAKSNTGCIMKSIGNTGTDGVRVGVPTGKKLLHAGFGNDGFRASDAGASLTTRAIGTVNGTPNTTLFTVAQTVTATGKQLQANFAGASVESVIVLNNGLSAYRTEVANNVVVQEEGFQLANPADGSGAGPASVQAAGDPIPGVDVSLEQVPGGIASGRSAILTYRSPRTFNIGGILATGSTVVFKRAFFRGLAAQVNDDTTAVLDEVEFTAVNPGGTTLDSLEIVTESATSGGGVTGTPAPAPRVFSLAASPNPFGAATALRFVLPTSERVRLGVYDLAGRLVRSLRDGAMAEGEHRAAWDGADAAGHAVRAGVYFVRLEAGERTVQSKVVRMQ